MTHGLALLLFIVAQNKSNSLEIGEVNTLSSSHASWAILDQPTLVWHDSALILYWINWFTTQCSSDASWSIKSNECSWDEVYWHEQCHCLGDTDSASCSLGLPQREAPLQLLDRYKFKLGGKEWEDSLTEGWVRVIRCVSYISMALYNTIFAVWLDP